MVRERIAADQAGIVVVDSAIRAAGWQSVGGAMRLGSIVPRARFGVPGRRRLVQARRPVRVPLQRVPNHALVSIIASASQAPCWVTDATAASANDNASATRGQGRARSSVRDLLFLAVLAATVAGAFWSGRQNAAQRIIVVPEAADAQSRVT